MSSTNGVCAQYSQKLTSRQGLGLLATPGEELLQPPRMQNCFLVPFLCWRFSEWWGLEREERLSGSSRSEPEVPAKHLVVFGYMGTSSVCLFPINMGQLGGGRVSGLVFSGSYG